MRLIYLTTITLPKMKAHSIQIINTCHALARSGCQVFLLIERGPCGPEEILSFYGLRPHHHLHFYLLPALRKDNSRRLRCSWRGVYQLSCLLTILWLKLKAKPQAIFVRDSEDVGFLLKYRPLFKLLKLPIIFEVHGVRNLAELYTKVDALIAITDGIREGLMKKFHISEHSITVIRHGVSLKQGAENPVSNNLVVDKPPLAKWVMYVGHLYAWKEMDILIDTFCHIMEATLVIVGCIPGSPDLARIEKLIQEKGIQDRVLLKEHIPPCQVSKMLAYADILVLPAGVKPGGFGGLNLKLFEYMRAQKPIVAHSDPIFMEILEDKRTAVLVPPNDPQAFAQGIQRVLDNPRLAASISHQAYSDVQEYSWEKRAQRITEVIHTLNKSY